MVRPRPTESVTSASATIPPRGWRATSRSRSGRGSAAPAAPRRSLRGRRGRRRPAARRQHRRAPRGPERRAAFASVSASSAVGAIAVAHTGRSRPVGRCRIDEMVRVLAAGVPYASLDAGGRHRALGHPQRARRRRSGRPRGSRRRECRRRSRRRSGRGASLRPSRPRGPWRCRRCRSEAGRPADQRLATEISRQRRPGGGVRRVGAAPRAARAGRARRRPASA